MRIEVDAVAKLPKSRTSRLSPVLAVFLWANHSIGARISLLLVGALLGKRRRAGSSRCPRAGPGIDAGLSRRQTSSQRQGRGAEPRAGEGLLRAPPRSVGSQCDGRACGDRRGRRAGWSGRCGGAQLRSFQPYPRRLLSNQQHGHQVGDTSVESGLDARRLLSSTRAPAQIGDGQLIQGSLTQPALPAVRRRSRRSLRVGPCH
jgi:hypothetical protein